MTVQPTRLYSKFSVRNLYTVFHVTFDDSFSSLGESHEAWELSFLMSGSLNQTVGPEVFRLEAGDISLVPGGTFHNIWIDSGKHAELFWVAFDGVGLSDCLTPGKYRINEESTIYFRQLMRAAQALSPDFSETGILVSGRTPLPARSSDYHTVKICVELLLLTLRKERPLPSELHSDEEARLFSELSDYLLDHVDDALTAAEVKDALHLPADRMRQMLQRFVGMGPTKYYNLLRCERVQRLLVAGHTVQEIADRMKFSSPYYLSYFFKRETGLTPRDYVRQQRSRADRPGKEAP